MLLVACTRNRPEPSPTATLAVLTAPVVATKSGAEPPVITVTDTLSTNAPAPGADAAGTGTPAADATQAANANGTPAPASFDYIVKAGETLGEIAARYNVDVDTVRRLNYLVDDKIFSGQILHIPGTNTASAQAKTTPGAETTDNNGTPTAAAYRYTVQAGDTLGAIAQRFGTTTSKIIVANNLVDPDHLFVGAKLIIPDYKAETSDAGQSDENTGDATPEAAQQGVEHIVQPGEGLSQIAEKYGVDEAAIAAANGIANRNVLRVGQKLIIPGVTAKDVAKARGNIHVVQSGESLAGIAAQYGISTNELAKMNNLVNPDAIKVGQELIVPEK